MSLPDGPHRRYDPLADRWVLVSAGRTSRPWLGSRERPPEAVRPSYDPNCYLCPGNERANGEQNPAYASTFVFTNDFAALQPDAVGAAYREELLIAEPESGTCRVVCFSPRHDLTLTGMPLEQVREVIDVWSDQTTGLGTSYRWVQVFENRGQAMGASNPHPHGQIWATSTLPENGAREDATQRQHYASTGSRLLEAVSRQESGGVRVVEEDDGWLALVPFWAVWPYETLLIARAPVARLADLGPGQRDALAAVMQRLMRRYDALFDQPMPFSMGWHQAPFGGTSVDHWTLHAHFLPPLLDATRRKFMVGYELLSEAQRDITAEEAAARLQHASSDEPQ